MHQVLAVNKPVGLTPLQLLDQLRLDQPHLQNEKLSYAGRLDPLAEGVILVLVGDANQERQKFLNLDKEYEFELVLGISTDSYDLLGMVEQIHPPVHITTAAVSSVLHNFLGKQSLPYPPYSSKTVQGKPLWWWAREGRLDEIKLPINNFVVLNLKLLKVKNISAPKLVTVAQKKISQVSGDFRQQQIVASWNQVLAKKDITLPLITCRINCSSGTYVRSLVHHLGQIVGTGAVTLSILRTKVGDYTL